MRYAVTGATGWLGRAAVSVLQARGADVVAFASARRDGFLGLEELPDTEHDVLLHFAYVTRERLSDLASYVAANVSITDLVREAVVRHRPAVFYASSGAADNPGRLEEDPYGALKRLDEHVLRDASGGRCAVARIYNVAGPHVRKPDVFLLTDLLTQARAGGPLRLRSDHPVVRSYVDVEDLAQWAIAEAGTDTLVSTAGDREVEAADLAELIARQYGVTTGIERPILRNDRVDRYVGDRPGWRSALAAAGITERILDDQVRRTARALEE